MTHFVQKGPRAEFRRAGGSAPCASHLFFWFPSWPCFSVLVGKAHRDPRATKGPPVLRVRKAIRGRLALLEWRGPKASKVSPAPKGRKGSKDLLVRKALKENRDRPARPGSRSTPLRQASSTPAGSNCCPMAMSSPPRPCSFRIP